MSGDPHEAPPVVIVNPGTSPVILAFPHTGLQTGMAGSKWRRSLNDNGRLLKETDWHLNHLYRDLLPDATTVRTLCHRYFIDANRDPTGASLYPGQNTTSLSPTTDFDGHPIWREGMAPEKWDVADWVKEFHEPYHAALAAEIARVHALHGIAVLYDCHSIRAEIPFLFEGTLPDFNVGTYDGTTCSPYLENATVEGVRATGRTWVLNGRFKGGWTVRHHGQPDKHIHAIQMELARSTYFDEQQPPSCYIYDAERAEPMRVHLKNILERIEAAAYFLKTKSTTP